MWTEAKLNELLSEPSDALVADIKKLEGDILVLGAGGKMGPTLCLLAKKAIQKAGVSKKVIAVSRGNDPFAQQLFEENDIETIHMDLLDIKALASLPDVENIIYMAGRKFGTDGSEWQTWAMNATLPAFIAERFKGSRIVVFSSGNVYPIVPLSTGGCTEQDKAQPIGEYAMSCLARERAFEYAANAFGTKVFIYRLSFAVDLRYGVLYDMAMNIINGSPISLRTPCLNCIWQGSANEIAIRGLLLADAPACIMNVTGPEAISIKRAAETLGEYLGKTPVFTGDEGQDAYLNNAEAAVEAFGYPAVPAKTLLRWQAEWLLDGGRGLNKPTHFEERNGNY